MENRQNVRWHFLMATDSKKMRYSYDFLISVSLLHLSSPSWARTNNPSVNSPNALPFELSRNYLRNLFLTIVTITQSFSKNKYFAENNYKSHRISPMAFPIYLQNRIHYTSIIPFL